MASIYWKGTDGAYGTNANWSGGAIPTTGDHVRLIAEYDGDILTNLDQSAVAIGDFVVENGNESDIGTIAGYLQIDPNLFEFSGDGTAFINLSGAAIPATVNNTRTPNDGERGLYLKGSAITTLSVQAGAVGLAVIQGDTATATSVRTISSEADLICGKGCTLTTAECLGGVMRIRASLTTLNVYGGTVYIEEAAAVTTVNVYGGAVHHNSTGTVTTWNARGGTSDWLSFAGARTVTDVNIYRGAVLRLNKAAVTYTNAPALIDTMLINTSIYTG
jgi:hypothetical protein